jgi:hypothetical protein
VSGAVSNFVTDADKRRKELLSRTLNLGRLFHFLFRLSLSACVRACAECPTDAAVLSSGACTLAQKTAKDQKKKLELEMEKTKIELAKAMAAHETWTKVWFSTIFFIFFTFLVII